MKKRNSTWEEFNLKIASLFTIKNIVILVLMISLILLIPILRLSFYTHPSADDYSYGIYTIGSLEKGIGNFLIGIGRTVQDAYVCWQGTYAAVVFFSLNPTVWGNDFYFLTTFIIMFSISFSCFYLFQQIKNAIKLDNKSFYFVYLLFITFIWQTIPDITQGLYWWNGSSYYMIFFSFELVLIALLIKRYFLNKETKPNYILLCFLIMIIGGGNYITALQQIIILLLLNIYLISKKQKSGILLLVLSIVSLLISAAAPGNSVRALNNQGMSAIKAIVYSFYYAFTHANKWMNPMGFVIVLLILAILSKSYRSIKINFKYPMICFAIAVCIFAAEFTPTLYAASNIGEGRLWNIMYISYYLLVLFVLYYFIGNIRQKVLGEKILARDYWNGIISLFQKNCIMIMVFLTALILCIIYQNRTSYTTYHTMRILINGEAKTYDQECKERLKILEDKEIKKVEFKPLTYYPYPIVYTEIEEDETNWKNVDMSRVYDKEFIKLVKKNQ